MAATSRFAELLEAVDELPADEQEELVSIVRRRLADLGRRRVLADIEESRKEFEAGLCRETTVDDLMREIQS